MRRTPWLGAASKWAEALVTEYTTGAGIGWHRDAPVFGIVAGISLGGTCRMRFLIEIRRTQMARSRTHMSQVAHFKF
jgi:alkylated DNA repair dioxygenase AlkB